MCVQDEDEPEAADKEEEEQDPFMVADGYLSEDEGVRDSQADGAGADPMCTGVCSAAAAG